jgi:type IV pilus assembly protein PilC
MVGVSYLMLTQIMPTMITTFTEMKLSLPASTQALVYASQFLTQHTVLFFVLLAVFIFAVVTVVKTKTGQWFIHRALIRAPIIGGMVVEVNAARAGRTLASLVASGVDMVRALAITRDVLQNTAFKEVMLRAEQQVIKGQTLSSVFTEKTTVYPLLFGEMIAVGEETGNMSEMLSKLATYYETEVDQKMKNLTSILEPILMLFIGGTVGFFAMAIISPIYALSDAV